MDAVIFVPLDCDTRRWTLTCWTYCLRSHLKPVAVAHCWADVQRMLLSGEARKVVVAMREHMDWLDVVSEERETGGPTPSSQQRTGRM